MKKTPAILAVGLIGLAALAVSPAAGAVEANTPNPSNSSPSTGVVIAQDTTLGPIATPIAPRAIQIQSRPGDLITLTTAGEEPRQVRADDAGSARVTKLTAGAAYTVTSTDGSTTVTPLLGAGRARNLQVTTTDAIDSVTLTWQHAATPARGTVGYRVKATPIDEGTAPIAPIVDEVTSTTAKLAGLNPQVRYSFSVTPFNALGDGKPSIALMNRSLSALSAPSAITEPAATPELVPTTPATPQQGSAAAPAPASAPATGPSASSPAPAAAPARPSTRTVYVCPDGFADQGGTCMKTMGYTYQTQGYTYTRGKTGTEQIRATCFSEYTDPEGVTRYLVAPHECTITRDVFGDIKNPTPAGWEDTGSNWRKKDDAPAGWSDDGSQWVQTTDKIALVIPA